MLLSQGLTKPRLTDEVHQRVLGILLQVATVEWLHRTVRHTSNQGVSHRRIHGVTESLLELHAAHEVNTPGEQHSLDDVVIGGSVNDRLHLLQHLHLSCALDVLYRSTLPQQHLVRGRAGSLRVQDLTFIVHRDSSVCAVARKTILSEMARAPRWQSA